MIHQLYSVKDLKADSYSMPFEGFNDEVCKRNLSMSLSGSKSPIAIYPSDFMLCYVGTFDDVSGLFVTDSHSICTMDNVFNDYPFVNPFVSTDVVDDVAPTYTDNLADVINLRDIAMKEGGSDEV